MKYFIYILLTDEDWNIKEEVMKNSNLLKYTELINYHNKIKTLPLIS